jgi:predicted small metal-binding protein
MAKVLRCRDVGMDCDFVARGNTEDEILKKAAEHARTSHNMNEIPPELLSKVRSVIRDEKSAGRP